MNKERYNAESIPPTRRPPAAESLERLLAPLDSILNRIFSSRWNPLYQSGTLAVFLFLIALVTGIYLLIFFRVWSPYDSVVGIHDQAWAGRWIRCLHRYASDAALVAIAVHVLKMLLSGRTWGPRLRAWVSGVLLVGTVLFCGWTGLVMVWDVQAQRLVSEGVQVLDLLPIFSEPISRQFATNEGVWQGFFFMLLFLHVAVPLAGGVLFFIHTSRLARPKFLPPGPMRWAALATLAAAAILLPLSVLPRADMTRIPGRTPIDLFFGFWIPLAEHLSAQAHAAVWLGAAGLAFSVPLWWRPRQGPPEPSRVDPDLCTGCRTCYFDCPYEAISMVERVVAPEEGGRASPLVARVNPALCVSCGICSGSCAPMGVGPPGRTGRDQLAEIRLFLEREKPGPQHVVVFLCVHNLEASLLEGLEGVAVFPVGCGGALHTSVIEFVLRKGAGGALVLTCPDRDCSHREGPRWLAERVYRGREAELQERVDRRRVRLAACGRTETWEAQRLVLDFRQEVLKLQAALPESDVEVETECQPQEAAC